MGKYQVIYADPPWAYRVWSKKGNGRSAESHYPTMSIEEIADLPVKKLADENCALFLWVTFPLLKEIWKVIDAWGFTYKSVAFVWIKQNKKADSLFWGMGYWTRANAEICILATKGSPKRYSKRVHQVIVSHIEEHSKKPEEARRRIEQLMGDVPRIELFARRETPGWDVWGNEVACSLGTEILQENLIVNLHIQSIDQMKAIKLVKNKVTDINRMKIEEQKKAVRAGYDMDIIPSDLNTYGGEAKRLLEDLQSRNERMFLVTVLFLNTAKTKQELDNAVFQTAGIAQKYNCSLRRF